MVQSLIRVSRRSDGKGNYLRGRNAEKMKRRCIQRVAVITVGIAPQHNDGWSFGWFCRSVLALFSFQPCHGCFLSRVRVYRFRSRSSNPWQFTWGGPLVNAERRRSTGATSTVPSLEPQIRGPQLRIVVEIKVPSI